MRTESETAPDPLQALGPDRNVGLPALTIAYHSEPAFVGARLVLPSSLVLGRHAEVFGAGVLADELLSRRHVELRRNADGGVVARDLQSRNGTFVNGARVDEAVLAPGSVLGIGSVMLVLGEGPAAFEPPRDPLLAGVSHALRRLLDDVAAVAREEVTVLVRGETGAGKELVARRIHEIGQRPGAFVAVNCGGIAESVVQSELFGHVRGAFSGADGDRPGLVEAARGGTLFLDEIGDAPPSLQTSLLRLLQDREYRPVGSDRSKRSDARFLAATHVRLDPAVAEGRFRQDLLGRLRRWVIDVPPLRERREDIVPIALAMARQRLGASATIGRALALELLLHGWPDNVRGLGAAVETALIDARGSVLELTPRVKARLEELSGAPAEPPAETALYRKVRPDDAYLRRRFLEIGGNMKALAAELGVARNTLYRWFQEAGIDPTALRTK